MIRRTSNLLIAMNKGPQYCGPTLQGWGRTAQKRRLEYEALETKYNKKDFVKNFDYVGYEQRCSDYMQLRTYFNIGGRWGSWLYNMGGNFSLIFSGTALFYYWAHSSTMNTHYAMLRAAWW